MKRSLAQAIIFSLLMGIVAFGGQMGHEQSGAVSTVQAKATKGDRNKSSALKVKSSTLKVKQGKKTICGKIFLPKSKKKKKFPTVIYSHGFGGSYEYGVDYAKALAKKGYAVYCFDFCGGSPDSRSSGSTLHMSIFTEQKDLEAVIKSLKKKKYVDQKNIFLFGTSQGGAVSAITAAKHRKEIRGLILFYPAFVLVDHAKAEFKSVDEIPDKYYFMWMEVGKTYFKDLLDYDIYEDIKAYKKKVLIVHGDADDIVPLSYSRKAVKTYSSAELRVIKGAGHGFDGAGEDKAVKYILNYLKKNVKKASSH